MKHATLTVLLTVKNKKASKQCYLEAFSILCDREGIQTPNLLIRSETLYSVELRSHIPDLGLQR